MDMDFGRFGSGRAVRRVEDKALLAGEGRFTGDFAPEGQAHLVFLRSPHAMPGSSRSTPPRLRRSPACWR